MTTARRASRSVDDAVEPFTSRVDYALAVVTTGLGDELAGCLVGFTTQCSIHPPRFMVCISRLNHTLSAMQRSGRCAVHLLGEDQLDLASLFGEETGDSVSKFDRCRWRRGITGTPVLEDCAAWIEGRVLEHRPVGDHEAFLVEPLDGGAGAQRGVLTYQVAPQLSPGHPIPDVPRGQSPER